MTCAWNIIDADIIYQFGLFASLSQLVRLEKLNLAGNNFHTGVPDVLTKLTSLKELNLASCRLSGIPEA